MVDMSFEEYYKKMCGRSDQPVTGEQLMRSSPLDELDKKELRWLVDVMQDEVDHQYNSRQSATNAKELRRAITILRKLKSQLEGI
jgi:Cu2+-containing amine oxidase